MLRFFAQTYGSSYDYGNSSAAGADAAAAGIATGILVAVLLFVLLIWATLVIGMWKVFEKAGQPGWKALIPIYNSWVLFEISGKPGYWVLASFIPFVGSILATVATIVAMLQLAKNFGKDTTFAVVFLILLPPIGLLRLGFGGSKYLGSSVGTSEQPVTTDSVPVAAASSTPSSSNEGVPFSQPSPQPQTQNPPQPPVPPAV